MTENSQASISNSIQDGAIHCSAIYLLLVSTTVYTPGMCAEIAMKTVNSEFVKYLMLSVCSLRLSTTCLGYAKHYFVLPGQSAANFISFSSASKMTWSGL